MDKPPKNKNKKCGYKGKDMRLKKISKCQK